MRGRVLFEEFGGGEGEASRCEVQVVLDVWLRCFARSNEVLMIKDD